MSVALGVYRLIFLVDRVHDCEARTDQLFFVRAILAQFDLAALEAQRFEVNDGVEGAHRTRDHR